MIERRSGFGFLLEATQTVGALREVERQNLQGDLAFQPRVARAIDFAHTALAKWSGNFVLPEARSGRNRHRVVSVEFAQSSIAWRGLAIGSIAFAEFEKRMNRLPDLLRRMFVPLRIIAVREIFAVMAAARLFAP